MIYLFFSHFLISSSSELSHHYDDIFAMNSAFQYSQNYDEIKVLNVHTYDIEKYDQLKEKFVSYCLGVDLINESILQVISQFFPFNDEQRFDVLTNCSNVYIIRYHKYKAKIAVQLLISEISSLFYVINLFNKFLFDNGTKIIFLKTLYILRIINYLYFTSNSLLMMMMILYQPQFMELIEGNVYIQCETLNYFVDQNLQQLQISAKSFSNKFQYLIIDNIRVYDKNLKFNYYLSKTPLYPINFENHPLTIKKNVLYVGEIIGLYLVKVNESIFLHFARIFAVKSGLQNLHLEEYEIIRKEKKFYFLNYLSGSDIEIVSGALSTETKKIKINQDIITSFKDQDNYLGSIFQSENMLSISFCKFQITYDEVQRQCEVHNDFFQIQKHITKSQSLMIQSTNQFMFFILDGNTLRLLNLYHAFDDIYDVLDFYYGNYILIVMKNSTTLFYYIDEYQYWMITSLKL